MITQGPPQSRGPDQCVHVCRLVSRPRVTNEPTKSGIPDPGATRVVESPWSWRASQAGLRCGLHPGQLCDLEGRP